jgi:hypothetical protein
MELGGLSGFSCKLLILLMKIFVTEKGLLGFAAPGGRGILELTHQNRFQPQYRMPDYAESGIACVVITAFSVTLFGIIRLSASTESYPVPLKPANATRPTVPGPLSEMRPQAGLP